MPSYPPTYLLGYAPPGFRLPTFAEMTPLGYPNEQPRVIPRKELSEIIFYEKYGQK